MVSGCQLGLLLSLTTVVAAKGGANAFIADWKPSEGALLLGERMAELESVLIQHAERLSHQEKILKQQAEQSAQDMVYRARLTEQLSAQDSLYRARLGEVETILRKQNDQLSIYNKRLTEQDTLLQKQGTQLSHQHAIISQLRQTVKRLETNEEHVIRPQGPLTDVMHKSDTDDKVEILTENTDDDGVDRSVDRGVVARSDDSGPLEVVVNQMGQQLTEMTADIQTLMTSSSQHDQQIQNAQTSTFVRWGNSHCGTEPQLVYSGVVGGSFYTHPGAATNYLCLTMSPIMSDHTPPANVAYLYGTEYDTFDTHFQKDALCAVCRSQYPTTIMIPGTTECTPGWYRQYSGYLMANYYNYGAGSEYICVDSIMESRPGTGSNNNGKLLYYTVAKCGSLPCDPYVDNKVVTCVVCSL